MAERRETQVHTVCIGGRYCTYADLWGKTEGQRDGMHVCCQTDQLGFKEGESAVCHCTHICSCVVPGFSQGSNGRGWGKEGEPIHPSELAAGEEELSPQEQELLTRWLPRAFRPTGLLMVAKFPKSSASGPVPLFASHCQCFLPPPQSSALRRVSEKFDRGNSQRRQGNPAQLATASLPSPIDPSASPTPASHRRKLSPPNSPPISHPPSPVSCSNPRRQR